MGSSLRTRTPHDPPRRSSVPPHAARDFRLIRRRRLRANRDEQSQRRDGLFALAESLRKTRFGTQPRRRQARPTDVRVTALDGIERALVVAHCFLQVRNDEIPEAQHHVAVPRKIREERRLKAESVMTVVGEGESSLNF